MTLPAVLTSVILLMAALAPAAPQSQKERDLREVTNYRLSTAVLDKLEVVYEAVAAEMAKDPEYRRMRTLRREYEELSQKDELTDAEAERLESLEEELERIEDEEESEDSLLGGADDPSTLSELAAQIEAEPRLAAAVAKSGMTPREFATAQLALFNAAIAHGFMKSGLIKELPPGVSKANVEFVEQHEEAITAMSDRWDELEP
jgi:glycine/D-amino acid oxidase-like deaminating enzyme